jgi:hypothetical protein
MATWLIHWFPTVLLASISGLYGWLIVANAAAFWRTWRFLRFEQTLAWVGRWLLTCLGLAPLMLPSFPGMIVLPLMLGAAVPPTLAVWRRWRGQVVEPGYARPRELLLLRRPLVAADHPDPAAGLYVPPHTNPDLSPLVPLNWLDNGRLRSIAVLLVLVAVAILTLWLLVMTAP